MNRIKRGLALLLALALVLLAGCSKAEQLPSSTAVGPEESSPAADDAKNTAPAKSLREHGQELVALMGEMAGNGAYIGLYTENTEIGEVLSAAGEGDFSNPKAVYRIQVPESALGQYGLIELESLDRLSPALRKNVKSKSVTALPTMLNSMGGANTLAAASICTANKTFRSDEVPDSGVIYLYLYEDAVPAAVVFLPGEDGTVLATGMLILYDGFQAESPEDISGLLGELGAEVTEIF